MLATVRITTSVLFFGSISKVLLFLDLAMLLPYLLFCHKYMVKPAGDITARAQQIKEKNLSYTAAIAGCSDTIYLYEAEEFVYKQYEKSSLELVKERVALAKRKAITDMAIPLIGRGGYNGNLFKTVSLHRTTKCIMLTAGGDCNGE